MTHTSAVLQRIVFPLPGDGSARALYVHAGADDLALTRTTLRAGSGAHVAFDTYFSSFPSGYWRAHTGITEVTLTLTVDGSARIRVWASDAAGAARVVETVELAQGQTAIGIPLDEMRGGRLWFDLTAGVSGMTISDASWTTAGSYTPASVSATVCITTHNRQQDCTRVLERLADEMEANPLIDAVVVVDQGDLRVRDAPGFSRVAAALGARLRVIVQPNLGGSGGFSRGMIEALTEGSSHALLLDDDVVLEPESIRRMLAFAAYARGPLIVGAHMLSLTDRTVLHSYGERVDRRTFWWSPQVPTLASSDIARLRLADTASLSGVYDVDFNGWWMCLIPAALIRRVGVALPMFIKWDDAEYGLRAAAAGVGTVSLPGSALWHMPWTAKDDGLDWQAYFQLRNRLVAALLHSPHRRGGHVLTSTLLQDLNHVLCLQYGSVALRRLALVDVLAGPEALPATLTSRMGDAHELLDRAGQVVVAIADLPPARRDGPTVAPVGGAGAAARAVRVLWRQLKVTPARTVAVDVHLARTEGKWWQLGLVDSATVVSASGRGAFVARRDRAVAVSLTRSAIAFRILLWWRWPALAARFRAAAPGLASAESWAQHWSAQPPT